MIWRTRWMLATTLAALLPSPYAAGQGQSQGVDIPRIKPPQFQTAQREVLRAIGNRLQAAGKERQVLGARFDRMVGGQMVSSVVALMTELPGMLRMEDPAQGQVTVFDGTRILTRVGSPGKTEEDAVESLLSDAVEGYFYGQTNGSRAMLQGRGYRIADNRSANALSGVCDLLTVTGGLRVRTGQETTQKTFCFDSVTHLPLVVSYERGTTLVETRFSDWRLVQGEQIPWKIVRLENGAIEMTWTLTSASISPGVADGLFKHP